MIPFAIKKIIGINSDGSIFKVLQSFILRMLSPELAIRIPPTIESSATSGAEKNDPDKKFATR